MSHVGSWGLHGCILGALRCVRCVPVRPDVFWGRLRRSALIIVGMGCAGADETLRSFTLYLIGGCGRHLMLCGTFSGS